MRSRWAAAGRAGATGCTPSRGARAFSAQSRTCFASCTTSGSSLSARIQMRPSTMRCLRHEARTVDREEMSASRVMLLGVHEETSPPPGDAASAQRTSACAPRDRRSSQGVMSIAPRRGGASHKARCRADPQMRTALERTSAMHDERGASFGVIGGADHERRARARRRRVRQRRVAFRSWQVAEARGFKSCRDAFRAGRRGPSGLAGSHHRRRRAMVTEPR